jgi:hypothetical protein
MVMGVPLKVDQFNRLLARLCTKQDANSVPKRQATKLLNLKGFLWVWLYKDWGCKPASHCLFK